MRLVTANVLNNEGLPAEITRDLSPDILAIQEIANANASGLEWAGDSPKKGVGLFAALPYERLSASGGASASVAIRVLESPFGVFHVLALWAKPHESSYFKDVMRSLDAHSADLRGLPTVVLGDLNLCGRIKGTGLRDVQALSSRMADELGCVSAYHAFSGEAFGQESATTLYFQHKEDQPFHCDFIFVPQAWQDRIQSVVVPGFQDYRASDHRPVICELA